MTINIEETIKNYIELRDLKAQMKAEYDEAVRPITKAMDEAEKAVLDFFNTTGQTSSTVKGVGTAYITKLTSAKVADWGLTLTFIRDHDLWHMLEHRVSKTAVEQYIEAHKDLPPGVDVTTSISVNIRR